MKDTLIIGLGNPGQKYQHNRHNVGQMFVDYLLENRKLQNANYKLLKTDCFMNESGKFVKTQSSKFKVLNQDLVIVHDDLDIPLGKFKIQFGVGPKVHNGLDSIEENLKTKDFWRVRIGVDYRNPENRTPGEKYVLEDFLREEKVILNELFPLILEEMENRLEF